MTGQERDALEDRAARERLGSEVIVMDAPEIGVAYRQPSHRVEMILSRALVRNNRTERGVRAVGMMASKSLR